MTFGMSQAVYIIDTTSKTACPIPSSCGVGFDQVLWNSVTFQINKCLHLMIGQAYLLGEISDPTKGPLPNSMLTCSKPNRCMQGFQSLILITASCCSRCVMHLTVQGHGYNHCHPDPMPNVQSQDACALGSWGPVSGC